MIISKEFIKYCLVGLVNTFVGIGSALICLNLFMLSYATATACSYILGILTSFYLNKKFTFKSNGKPLTEFVKFAGTMFPAYVLSYWAGYSVCRFLMDKNMFDFAAEIVGRPASLVSDNIALLLSMAIYLILGFSVNKFFVFMKK